MNPKISILVPCYQQAQYLDECLQSVLDQTYVNWECIIINDGSSDNTEEVVKKWIDKDFRFQYIYSENKGVSQARNSGITIAKGDFIQFLDGDDILEKDKLEYQIAILSSNPDVAIVYGSSRYFFDGDKDNLYPIHYQGISPVIEMNKRDSNQKEVLVYNNICTNCAGLYRKKIFENIKFKELIYEDWFFHIECALNNFIFHFSNKTDGNCLIRMTNQSQMNKHALENKKNNDFQKALDSLLASKHFSSKLMQVKMSYKTSDISVKNSFFKKLIYNVTPPVLQKLYKKIENKF